ncbi:phage DNA ejection protein [Proteus terrae]|uniref:phage DNA ejection protein n=1 Tax=Proteus terrae TaxID=1574161 RepID=UPI003C2AC573
MATWQPSVNSGGFLGSIGQFNDNAPRASDANPVINSINQSNELARSGANNMGLQALNGLVGLAGIYQENKAKERLGEFQKAWGEAMANNDTDTMKGLFAEFPEMEAQIGKGMEGIHADVRKSTSDLALGYYAAVVSGKPEEFVIKNADKMRQYGFDPQVALSMAKENPSAAREYAVALGMSAEGSPELFINKINADENRKVTVRGQDISAETARRGQSLNYQSSMTGHNLSAQRLSLDKEKFEFEQQQAIQKSQSLIEDAPKLSVNMEKNIETAVTDASNSRNSANSMMSLATQFRKEVPKSGLAGNVNNTVNQLMGSDTAMRDLRIRQSALVNNQVLKFLPPGPATDRDVEIVREGAPTTMDNPEVVARWLESMARMEQRSAAFNDFKAEWFSANGNPGQSRSDREILGMQVNKGESLNVAAKRYMASYEKELPQLGTPSTQQTNNTNGQHGGGQSGSIPEGTTATNPKTGQKIIFRGGQWQPI